ncbi:MAG: hypothetical protein ACO1O3_10920 [Sphingobium sp.]
MGRALPLIAAVWAAVGLFSSLQAAAAERAHLARLYSCEVFGGDGKLFDTFGVAIRPQAREGFEYEVEILYAKNGSGRFPVSAKALAGGEFEIVSRAMGPNGEPPNAFSPRTGVKLVFEGSHPGNSGYAVIYRDGPSSNFEVAGYHPVAAGICTLGGKPGA